MMGLVPLEEEMAESLFPLSRAHHEKAAVCKSGRELSPETESACALILCVPVSRTVRSKSLWLKPPSLWHSVLQQPEQNKTGGKSKSIQR